MSSTSSCASSPFSSPESGAEVDLLDMPMFFPSESSIYQQILDLDGSNEVLAQQQQQQQYQSFVSTQQQKYQYDMPQIGLGTPPTSPSAPTFYKYAGGATEIGTMYYGAQPQAIHNVYVPVLPQQPHQQKQLQQQLAYHVMMQQFDNLESSLFSPSPITSSCSSSLTSSPYAETSPLAAIGSDFDLFPLNNNAGAGAQQQVATAGYPSAPVMSPSVVAQSMYSSSNNQSMYQSQMTPPMNQMDLEREVSSLFNQQQQQQQPLTTEMSLLCKCPGQYPCGQQFPTETSMVDSANPCSESPLPEVQEEEFSESESGSEEEQDLDPSYMPSSYRPRANTMGAVAISAMSAGPSRRKSDKARSKSMVISTASSGSPYSSPFSKDSSYSSPTSPVRQDRRRSSSSSSFGGSQLVDVENLPAIEDPHVCPVCSRRFNRPFNLRSHILTHTTSRPFPCTLCSWKFTRHHDLLRHCKAKHPESLNNNNSDDKKKAQTFTVV
ncbi:hypothetical protein BGX28_003479 [Mortierella sp. GBA30]|nr:hypothetical protein BGX28_003479 [Mortierella sp. GBA30]